MMPADGMTIKYQLAVDAIKNNISAVDVGRKIGLNIDRHGRCSCPFHNGKDRNMKLFDGNRGYSCFVCHQSGDVIQFIRHYYNLSFKECISWFNEEYGLNLDLDAGMKMDPEKQRQAENALQRRKNAIELQAWKERMMFDLSLLVDRIIERLEDIRDEKRPKTYGEWDPEFCAAVAALPEARRLYDDIMMECMKKPDDNPA